MPHQDPALNRANAAEWWEIFRNHDAGRFGQAVAGLIRQRNSGYFPKVKELSDYYEGLGAMGEPESAELSPRDRRLFAQFRAIDEAIADLSRPEKEDLYNRTKAIIEAEIERKNLAETGDMFHISALVVAALIPLHQKMLSREMFAREHGMPLDFKSGLLDGREGVMPVNRPDEKLIGQNYMKTGGRVGIERPAQRYQPPPEIEWESEVPF
jgi:hypothetical protein